MDILKLFPALLLDFISKVIPGCIFLVVFQNRYLPPTDFVLQMLALQSLPAEWQSWYRVGMLLVTAYVIGIFIAILANAIDGVLIRRYWYKVISRDPNSYIYPAEQPQDLSQSLASSSAFALFVDHCRSYVSVNNTAAAAMLEKYRTAYRLFVGLAVLFLALPLGLGASPWSLGLVLCPIAAWLAFFMAKRYLLKSLQFFALAQAAPTPEKP
jgi:hypothetical protein